MKHLSSYSKWSLIGLLILGLGLAACEKPFPEDELPPLPTSAPITELPTAAPTVPVEGQPTTPPDGQDGQTTPEATAVTPPDANATPVVDPTAVPTVDGGGGQGQGGQTIHVVAPGDTLYNISQRYGVSMDEIAAANNLVNPNNLVVGQQLIIPTPGSVVPTPPPGGEQTHTVKPGENLFRIGLQYGCTVDQMSAYNNIPYPYTIYVGDVIRIPPEC